MKRQSEALRARRRAGRLSTISALALSAQTVSGLRDRPRPGAERERVPEPEGKDDRHEDRRDEEQSGRRGPSPMRGLGATTPGRPVGGSRRIRRVWRSPPRRRGSRSPAGSRCATRCPRPPLSPPTRFEARLARPETRGGRRSPTQVSRKGRRARLRRDRRTHSQMSLPSTRNPTRSCSSRFRAVSAHAKRTAAVTTSMNCGLKTRFVRRKSAGASAAIARPPVVERRTATTAARSPTSNAIWIASTATSAECGAPIGAHSRSSPPWVSPRTLSGKYHTDSFVASLPL